MNYSNQNAPHMQPQPHTNINMYPPPPQHPTIMSNGERPFQVPPLPPPPIPFPSSSYRHPHAPPPLPSMFLNRGPSPQHHKVPNQILPPNVMSSTSMRKIPPPPPPPPLPRSMHFLPSEENRLPMPPHQYPLPPTRPVSLSSKPGISINNVDNASKQLPKRKKRRKGKKNFQEGKRKLTNNLDPDVDQKEEIHLKIYDHSFDTPQDPNKKSQPLVIVIEDGDAEESESSSIDQTNHEALGVTSSSDIITSFSIDQGADATSQSIVGNHYATDQDSLHLDDELAAQRSKVLKSMLGAASCASSTKKKTSDTPQSDQEQIIANAQVNGASTTIPDIAAVNASLMVSNIWECSDQMHLIRIISNDPIILSAPTEDTDSNSDSDAMDESDDEIETNNASNHEDMYFTEQKPEVKIIAAVKSHEHDEQSAIVLNDEEDNQLKSNIESVNKDKSGENAVNESDLVNQKLSILKQIHALKVKQRALIERKSQNAASSGNLNNCEIHQNANDKANSTASIFMDNKNDAPRDSMSTQTMSNNPKDPKKKSDILISTDASTDNKSNSIHIRLDQLKKQFAAKLKERQNKLKQCNGNDDVQQPKETAKKDEEPISNRERLLMHKQKLKRDIEISNLRMLVSRQRTLLSTYSKKLEEHQSELSHCDSQIIAEERKIVECEEKVQSLEKRKVRMENLLVRATRNLVETRSRLNKVCNSSSVNSSTTENQNESEKSSQKEETPVPTNNNRKRAADFF